MWYCVDLIVCTGQTSTLISSCSAGAAGKRKPVWTAGRRIDPNTESTFVWKVSLSNGTVIQQPMVYTHWSPGQPSFGDGVQSCMAIGTGSGYAWDDIRCTQNFCSLCEIDL